MACTKRRAVETHRFELPATNRPRAAIGQLDTEISTRSSEPGSADKPHLHGLCEQDVAKQRSEQDWPIERRQRGESERGREGRVGQPRGDGHDRHGGHRELPTRATLDEGNFIGADDVDDQRLGNERLDEPAGLKKRSARGVPVPKT